MSLAHGGHLTHGSPVNMSGKYFNFVSYGLGDDETIDYDKVEELAKENKPKLIVAGASAYPRIIDFKRLSEIAKSVGSYPVSYTHLCLCNASCWFGHIPPRKRGRYFKA